MLLYTMFPFLYVRSVVIGTDVTFLKTVNDQILLQFTKYVVDYKIWQKLMNTLLKNLNG